MTKEIEALTTVNPELHPTLSDVIDLREETGDSAKIIRTAADMVLRDGMPKEGLLPEVMDVLHVDHMIERGYATEPPTFYEQCADNTRTAIFKYIKPSFDKLQSMTEHDGLNQLRTFLMQVASDITSLRRGVIGPSKEGERRPVKGTPMALIDRKNVTMDDVFEMYDDHDYEMQLGLDVLENLTFIGEPEFEQSTRGIGLLWKRYLDENPDLQLVIDASTKQLPRYHGTTGAKSDAFIRDQILMTFTDDELDQYSGRIVTDIEQVRANPDNVRVIMLDDWSMTGTQISDRFNTLLQPRFHKKGLSIDNVEVHLLCARPSQINKGIATSETLGNRRRLPVKAFYVARQATVARDQELNPKGAYVTGLHSAANVGFQWQAANLIRYALGVYTHNLPDHTVNRVGKSNIAIRPALTNIVSMSRRARDTIEITANKLRRVS